MAIGPDYSVRPYAQSMSNDTSPVSSSDLKDVQKMADNVSKKQWGIDIRYSISSAMLLLDQVVANNVQRQSNIENQWQDVLDETTNKDFNSAPEIRAARDGEANLKARLDKEHQKVTAQLAHNTNYTDNVLAVGNYSDFVQGGDWSYALEKMEEDLDSDGGVLLINRPIVIKRPVNFIKRVVLKGLNYSHTSAQSSNSSILKVGNFDGITLNNRNSGVTDLLIDGERGNEGNGLQVKCSRPFLKNVAVLRQGGHGILLGGENKPNVNVWNFLNIITVLNGEDGLHLDWGKDKTVPPDLTAGILNGLDTRSNGGHGLYVGTTLNNSFYGVVSQENGKNGILVDENAVGNHFYNPYVEKNGLLITGHSENEDFLLNTGSRQNYVIGQRARIAYRLATDLGVGNTLIDYETQMPGSPLFNRSGYNADNFAIKNRDISGYWKIANENERDLNFLLKGTSADGKVSFVGDGKTQSLEVQKLEFERSSKGMTDLSVYVGSVALANIEPNQTKDLEVIMDRITKNSLIQITPRVDVPQGLSWSSYIKEDGIAIIRFTNISQKTLFMNNISVKATAINTEI